VLIVRSVLARAPSGPSMHRDAWLAAEVYQGRTASSIIAQSNSCSYCFAAFSQLRSCNATACVSTLSGFQCMAWRRHRTILGQEIGTAHICCMTSQPILMFNAT